MEMPADHDAVRAALGITPATTLPAGYLLRSVAIIGTGPEAVYHLRYDDGWSVISLFLGRSRSQLPGAAASQKVALAGGEAQWTTRMRTSRCSPGVKGRCTAPWWGT